MRGSLNPVEHASAPQHLLVRGRSLAFVLLVVAALTRPPTPAAGEVCAYVANQDDATLSVIDTATQTVVSALQVGAQPTHVAVGGSASSLILYVVNRGDDTLSIIRTTKRRSATVRVGSNPVSVAVSPDGTRAYVANEGSGTVSVVNTTAATVSTTIEVGGSPRDIALTPAGNLAYVATTGEDRAVVIDAAANRVLTNVVLSNAPSAVAVSPAGRFAYAYVNGTPVSLVDTTTQSIVGARTLPPNSRPTDLAFAPDGATVFVGFANPEAEASIWVFDTDVLSGRPPLLARIGLGSQVEPLGLAVTGDGSALYVTNGTRNEVLIIDTATNTVSETTIPVGRGPRGIAIAAVSGGCSVDQPNPCSGDCDGSGSVSIGELVSGVGMALGSAPSDSCLAFDRDGDGSVAVNELVAAVNAALRGCP